MSNKNKKSDNQSCKKNEAEQNKNYQNSEYEKQLNNYSDKKEYRKQPED